MQFRKVSYSRAEKIINNYPEVPRTPSEGSKNLSWVLRTPPGFSEAIPPISDPFGAPLTSDGLGVHLELLGGLSEAPGDPSEQLGFLLSTEAS